MIFKKKPKQEHRGLKEAPESLEYKKNMGNFELRPNSEDSDSLPNLPEFDEQEKTLPPLNKDYEELEEPPKEERRNKRLPKDKEIFVKIDNFKAIVQSIENLEKKLKEMEGLIEKLKKSNDDEVFEINSWKTSVDDLREEIKEVEANLDRE